MKSSSRVSDVGHGLYEVFLPLPMRPSVVNVWLIDGGTEWALIDTGMHLDESLRALDEALQALPVSPGAIGKIICTHHHPDHFGASGPLRELFEAEVFLHSLEVDRAQSLLPHRRLPEAASFIERNGIPLKHFAGLPTPGEFLAGLYVPATPDHLIADGDMLAVGQRQLRVVWTPGHAPGHCCLYIPETKTLIAGDHLLPKISPHVGVYPFGPENPLGDYLASLDKVASLDVNLVLPAHGSIYRGHRRRVAQLHHHHEYRMLAAIDAVRTRPHTAYEVAQRIFDFDEEAPIQVQFPATFEALAHLELLVRRGRVSKLESPDRVRFAAA